MKILSVFGAALLVLGIGFKISQDPLFERFKPANTTVPANTLVAPTFAQDFFVALCDHDAAYLSTHTAGNLVATEEDLTAFFARQTSQCFGVRYLGRLTSADGYDQYIYVLSYGPDGEMWYVMTAVDGMPVDLE